MTSDIINIPNHKEIAFKFLNSAPRFKASNIKFIKEEHIPMIVSYQKQVSLLKYAIDYYIGEVSYEQKLFEKTLDQIKEEK